MFSEKSFNFRPILTVVYILSADFTPFTLLYFTKEIGRLMTQERDIRPAGKDENYMQTTKIKDRWQNLKVFEFQRKKNSRPDAGYDSQCYGQACHEAAIFMNCRINARLCGKQSGLPATP